jgi:hypothetical protein
MEKTKEKRKTNDRYARRFRGIGGIAVTDWPEKEFLGEGEKGRLIRLVFEGPRLYIGKYKLPSTMPSGLFRATSYLIHFYFRSTHTLKFHHNRHQNMTS